MIFSVNIFNAVELIGLYDFSWFNKYFSIIDVHKSLAQISKYFLLDTKITKSAANYVKSVYCVYFVVKLKFAENVLVFETKLLLHKPIRVH